MDTLQKRYYRKKLLTYALLDEQSDACFVKEDLGRFDVDGPEVELKLSTVLAEEVKAEGSKAWLYVAIMKM